ncbi:hypothetical protein B0O99DRAFT_687293 [Bisporella sp. PMI_857]|nr:hypothetical protein B0O99DRAFT_687293 [Bisporella sp. PMI_857]
MQAPKVRLRNRLPKSCVECRRRKQRCIPSKEGPCSNCLRRYPPVECIGLPEFRQPFKVDETFAATDDLTEIKPWLIVPSAPNLEPQKALGGRVTAINTLNGMPIKPGIRNAELLHFFQEYVMPHYVSIDGKNLPALFVKAILPWMIQSPLMPNIAILMASCSQRIERGMDIDPSQTLSIKSHVLSLVTQYLKQDFALIGDEAVRAVTHLVIVEWWWGTPESLWAHMNGIREMIHLQGGMDKFPDPTLSLVLTLTDLELACGYERELFFDYPPPPPSDSPARPPPASLPPAISLSSPLLAFPTTFKDNISAFKLTPEAADILDDVSFLSTSLTSTQPPPTTNKVISTASWLHSRISSLPIQPSKKNSSEAAVADTIRLCAIVYTSCISTLTPFASPPPVSLSLLPIIKKNIAKVPLARWKEIPGVFLWVLLVICPSCAVGDDIEGRRLRKMMAVTGMAIGLEGGFATGIAYLRGFWGCNGGLQTKGK